MPKSDCSQQNVLETSQQIFWRLHSAKKKIPFGLVIKTQPMLWKEGKENKGNIGRKQARNQERRQERKKEEEK